jgi:Tol biopolymer transport system component
VSPYTSTPRWLSTCLSRLALGTVLFSAHAFAQVTERVDVDTAGLQANASGNLTTLPSRFVSGDGRFALFFSDANNLVPGDTNGTCDIFVRDRQNSTTELISVDSGGVQGNGLSGLYGFSISTDGRFVCFNSAANNLVPGDTNGMRDLFLRDRFTGTTERISVDSSGNQADGYGAYGSFSEDSRYVAFTSDATNLAPGDTNGTDDIFVRDRQAGTTDLISVNFGGVVGNAESSGASISADGRFVAFTSLASNLVGVDTNAKYDVFIRDRQNGTTQRMSVTTAGGQGNDNSYGASISADGRYVAFTSWASTLVPNDSNGLSDVFIHDRLTGVTQLVSLSLTGGVGNLGSADCSMTPDGRFIAFVSAATDLVPSSPLGSQARVFVRDMLLGTTSLVSRATDGSDPTSGWCQRASISADGRYVAYESSMTTLVSGDTNGVNDVFISDRLPSGFTSLCDPAQNNVMPCPCGNPASSTGRGCDNSALTGGAILSAIGNAYLSIDSLSLKTAAERPTATSILLQGDASLPGGSLFGQGVRCVGGNMKRLFVKVAASGGITAPDSSAGDPSLSSRSAALGVPLQPGQPYFYLVYYRDPIVLGGCWAGNTFNCTQTGSVSWWP